MWSGVAQVVVQLTRVIVLIVLARLLTPHDYGLAAMVVVFSGLVLLFADLGFGAAIVQRQTLTALDCSTVFWVNLCGGVVLTLIGVTASGAIAAFYGEPAVGPMFAVVSISFFFAAIESTQVALLKKGMRFRALQLRRMLGTVAGACVAIAAAAAGAGAWSIIASQITFAVTSVVLVWTASSWRPCLAFSFASLRSLGGFGTKVFGWDALFYLNRNTDNLLIGRYLGSAPLGLYNVAYNVTIFPIDQIAGPIREVLFPAFSRLLEQPSRIGELWLRATRLIAAALIPALAGLAAVAPDFVPVVLGERWRAAVPVVQILVWVALLKSLQRLNGTVLQACGRPGWGLSFAGLAFVASFTAFVIGLRWGINGVAACYAVATTLIQPFYTWLTARATGLSLRVVLRSLAGIVEATVVMVAFVLAVRLILEHKGVDAPLRLLASCLTGLVIFVPVCAWRSPDLLAEVRTLLGRHVRSRLPHREKAPAGAAS